MILVVVVVIAVIQRRAKTVIQPNVRNQQAHEEHNCMIVGLQALKTTKIKIVATSKVEIFGTFQYVGIKRAKIWVR